MNIIQPKQKKVVTTVRIDPTIKSWAQSYASSHGTDLSTLINMQLFEIRKRESFANEPRMSNAKYEYYKSMSDDADAGNIKIEKFSSISDMMDSYR